MEQLIPKPYENKQNTSNKSVKGAPEGVPEVSAEDIAMRKALLGLRGVEANEIPERAEGMYELGAYAEKGHYALNAAGIVEPDSASTGAWTREDIGWTQEDEELSGRRKTPEELSALRKQYQDEQKRRQESMDNISRRLGGE